VDGSGSICDRDVNVTYDATGEVVTCSYWSLLLRFMQNFVQDLDVGVNGTRVALVTFGTMASIEFNLNE
jgi:hypothetical protein